MISGYGGYDIGFAAHSNFSIDGEWGKNVIYDVAKVYQCILIKEKKDMVVLGKGPTDGLDDTAIMAEAKYSVIIHMSRKKISLILQYSGANSFLYANGVKIC